MRANLFSNVFVYLLPIFLFSAFGPAASGKDASLSDLEFKAEHYERDLQNDTIRGRGKAWIRRDGKELSADEIEVDFNSKRAIASGNVHIHEGDMDIWSRHANYNLNGEDAVLEEAILSSGQLVLTGQVVRKLGKSRFEIEEGTYTNCNVDLVKNQSLRQCPYDWKLSGRYFSVTLEKYAHVQDAIIYIKDLPIFFSPYFIAPVKTERQSGLLMPSLSYSQIRGSGLSMPYFWAAGPWHDLTITPTYYGIAGYHLGVNYRYIYSPASRGEANFFLLQKRFSEYREDRAQYPVEESRFPGVGEWAISMQNTIALGGRNHSRQTLRFVSDPYYIKDYNSNIDKDISPDVASLRSLVSATFPGDKSLFTAVAQHQQSMIIGLSSRGVDRGSPTQLPALSFFQTNSPFFSRFASYELDTRIINFFRPGYGYDFGPDNRQADLSFAPGNYIRTGRRLQLEPRLVLNIPLGNGFQFLPNVRAGTLIYQFDTPNSPMAHQDYGDLEIPISLYLSRRFSTEIEGYERVSHIFQPRFVYASRFFQRWETEHPFFYENPTLGYVSPKFDSLDRTSPFEYMRFELINRFIKKRDTGAERFLLVQLSEQFNLRTYPDDTRYQKRKGPIELLSELAVWRFTGQLQANYQLETTQRINPDNTIEEVRENDWSSSLAYRSPGGDLLSLNTRFSIRADDTVTEKTAYFSFYKRLPIFFDVDGGFEYSMQRNDLRGYRLGLIFSAKPRSCWEFVFSAGRNTQKQPFALFNFRLNFGNPNDSINRS